MSHPGFSLNVLEKHVAAITPKKSWRTVAAAASPFRLLSL